MRVFPLVCLLICTACSYLNPATLARMAAMSPMTADPEGIEVVVSLPEGVEMADGAAFMHVRAERSDTGQVIEEHIDLERTLSGTNVIWRIKQKDLDRLRRAQKTVGAWESEVPDASSGSFSVGVRQCFSGRLPAPEEEFSIALRTEKDGPLRSLMTNVPFSRLYEEVGKSEELSQVCGS